MEAVSILTTCLKLGSDLRVDVDHDAHGRPVEVLVYRVASSGRWYPSEILYEGSAEVLCRVAAALGCPACPDHGWSCQCVR